MEMGPAAGVQGGHVVAAGLPAQVLASPDSITAQYLTGRKRIEVPATRRPGHPGQTLRVVGARANNLQNISVDIPLGTFACVTGVSAGGKSTLAVATLYKPPPPTPMCPR